jgi:hypothetical protein
LAKIAKRVFVPLERERMKGMANVNVPVPWRERAREVFSVRRFTAYDTFLIALCTMLIFTGHWVVWIPLAVLMLLLGNYAEHVVG